MPRRWSDLPGGAGQLADAIVGMLRLFDGAFRDPVGLANLTADFVDRRGQLFGRSDH